ncbi:aminopeptidase [Peribacillus deserti]|uniref:Aminopeptidase n=1 Tax=Peribacillus deserti TaxID=673318 RepID=A0ABS2QBS9_9BACI|nr:aminopeptidase [Peribacillus deserti]MBM7690620.1 aminopeptidase [Peribacillus deserti]
MAEKAVLLEKYADVALKIGVNIQPGQPLVIQSPISAADFARVLARRAFSAGAGNVFIEWGDEAFTRIKTEDAPVEALKFVPEHSVKLMEEYQQLGAAFLQIYSPNPDAFTGVDPERMATRNKANAAALENFKNTMMKGDVSWNLISTPAPEWAQKVYPDLSLEDAVEKLWDAIFSATRIHEEDPVEAWKEHGNNLHQKLEYLNTKKYKKLHYKAPGTDLTVELPEGHKWIGGSLENSKGIEYTPNIPTEEVFTMPKKDGVNGTVTSTKPLNYNGTTIDHFSLTFKEGKAVEFTAETGEETLKKMLDIDEGAAFLGEVALVPHDSPISNTNIIFYNTLFDENASCHFAVGSAYPMTLEGGTAMSQEQLAEAGANYSLSHVDFMIGSAELDIDGVTADGQTEPLFRNGNWAF